MRYLIPIAFAGIVLFGVFKALMPRTIFTATMVERKLRIVKGKAPRGFVPECEELLLSHNICEAKIKCVDQQGRLSLKFSNNIPAPLQQRMRNVWSFTRK